MKKLEAMRSPVRAVFYILVPEFKEKLNNTVLSGRRRQIIFTQFYFKHLLYDESGIEKLITKAVLTIIDF